LARILASQPSILMLDEPFSALDSYLKWQLELEMANVLESFDGTTLFVSHNRDEVYRICDKVAVLSDGRIDKLSDKWELFSHPQTLASSLLTGCKNTSPAVKLSEHEVKALDWGLTFTCEETVPDNIRYLGIRAHYFTACKNAETSNTFLCEIVRVIEDTFSTIVVVRNQGRQPETETGCIRWELPKEQWKHIKDRPIYLHIEPKYLQLLGR
ncbi:MAG TPA: hypothetical protein VHO84_01205, partial [Syntrophorhabdaceae bacterium]|nr:hypothetical protein [Syntrophorhabdaceae bacterium]